MFQNDKKMLLFTSLLTLLPAPIGFYLWRQLSLADNSWTPSVWLVLFPALSMLAGHWFCAYVTARDPGNAPQSPKLRQLVLWIFPAMSILLSFLTYALMLGIQVDVVRILDLAMGLMFVCIGNYLPKTKPNRTIGIRIPWTFSSPENWAATHRFSGKVWVLGGLCIMLGALLPTAWGAVVMVLSLCAMVGLSIGYSIRFYQKEKQAGKTLSLPKSSPAEKAILKFTAVVSVLILILVAVLLFTGDIHVELGADSFTVKASYYSDLTVRYDAVDSLEYRDTPMPGSRINGVGSYRLLMGWFRNEELGTYTRYTYTKAQSCILLTVRGKSLVLSGKTDQQTRQLYEVLQSRIP